MKTKQLAKEIWPKKNPLKGYQLEKSERNEEVFKCKEALKKGLDALSLFY